MLQAATPVTALPMAMAMPLASATEGIVPEPLDSPDGAAPPQTADADALEASEGFDGASGEKKRKMPSTQWTDDEDG